MYNWVDISGTGTSISLSDDDFEEVALPFTFEFYGVAKNLVKISSNGYLTFGTDGTDFSNDPITDGNDPDDFIAPFWDDINPADGGTIHYQDMGDGRFIVQYTDVHRFSDGATTLTFQVVLNQGGSMNFYFESMVGTLDSATIGIENADASDGLQVVFNAPYVHNDLAVRISSIWVSANPTGGTVTPAGSENVELLFDSAGLAEGTYTADMTITTNEPGGGFTSTVIPLTFIVGADVPIAVVDPTDIDLEVQEGQTLDAIVTISNAGTAELTWSLSTPPGWLSYSADSGSVPAGGSEEVTFTLDAGTLPIGTTETTTETFTTNAAGGGASIDIDVQMNVILFVATEGGLDFPGTHLLSETYPNPFNPTATFTLAVADAQNVRIVLYDVRGRLITTLNDDVLAGRRLYTYTIDGRNLTSGTYFVRITGETFADSHRITLLK